MAQSIASLFLLLMSVSVGAQLSDLQKQSLDQFIKERSHMRQMSAPVIGQISQGLEQRIFALEKKIMPMSGIISRAILDLNTRDSELSKRKHDLESGVFTVNPYENSAWLTQTRTELKQLCCEIKSDPTFAGRVLTLVERGIALTEANLYGDLADSANDSLNGSAVANPAPGRLRGARLGPGGQRGTAGAPFFRRQFRGNGAGRGRLPPGQRRGGGAGGGGMNQNGRAGQGASPGAGQGGASDQAD